jgi:hypothetical protein
MFIFTEMEKFNGKLTETAFETLSVTFPLFFYHFRNYQSLITFKGDLGSPSLRNGATEDLTSEPMVLNCTCRSDLSIRSFLAKEEALA